MNLMDSELLQQLCVEQNEDATSDTTRFVDIFLPNLTTEEQWVSFVLSQQGVDHIRDFFLRNYETSHIQWYLNKPLAKNSTGRTVLHIEARDQRCYVLSLLLSFGGSPNVTDAELKTPVHYAVIYNSMECLDSLLEWGGDLFQRDKSGKSPLDYFTGTISSTIMNTLKRYSAGLELILDNKIQQAKVIRLHSMISDQEKSLSKFKKVYHSCSAQEKKVCLGSVISNQTLLYRACKAGWSDGVSFILSKTVKAPSANRSTNETPLHAACEGNHSEIVLQLVTKFPELLLEKDQIPYRGWYPIHTACANGASEKIIAMILVGIVKLYINSPVVSKNLSFLDSFGYSPLFIAARCGNLPHVSLFLHPTLHSTLLHFVPSLLGSISSPVPTKCSVIHAAVLGNNLKILDAIVDAIPKAKMFQYIPCKLLSGYVLSLHGYYLTSYSQIPVELCEDSKGELDLVSCDAVNAKHTSFDQMVLSPLALASVLDKTEFVATMLKAGMTDTNNLALRFALFMKNSEIIVNLLFHQEKDAAIFKADSSGLLSFPVSPCISKCLLQCTKIDLQKNSLTEIPLSLFQIPTLMNLNLSHNNLASLPVGEVELNSSFKAIEWGWNCKCLKYLNVNFNAIHSLPEAVWALPNLEYLDASHNRLKEIPPVKHHSNDIHTVDISYNNLTQVAPFLFSYEEINLSFNKLTSLPMELWYSKSIKVLNVSNNDITDICFSCQTESVTVSFTAACTIVNDVKENVLLVDQIDTISSLSKLDLSHNKLSAFPKDLACFATHLQQLDISSNWINGIDVLLIPPYLKTLVAKNCHIAQFGCIMSSKQKETFRIHCSSLGAGSRCPHRTHTSLQYLSGLHLSNNKLRNIQFVTLKDYTPLYPELNVLNLSGNELWGAISSSVKVHRNLFSLDLSNNPQLELLPMELSLLQGTLFSLNISNLPNLRDPPKDYCKLPVNNLLSYMKKRMERSVNYHQSLRLMVFGDHKTGKSTLIERLKKRKPKVVRPSSQHRRQGIHIRQWSYSPSSSHKTVKFKIWECSDQDVCQATHHCFYSKQALYVVVFNLTVGEKGVRGLHKWLVNIKANAPTSPVIIVGTHLDHVESKQVSSLKELIDTLYSDTMIYPAIATIACVNSTTLLLNRNSMINMLRKQIYFVATHLFLDHGKVVYQPLKTPEDPSALLNQLIPQSYIDLEEAVQSKATEMKLAKEIPILTQAEFFSYFMPNWQSDQNLNRKFQYLHEQGVLLYYTNYLHTNIFCIDIQWICNVVKSILVLMQTCDGIISQEQFFKKCTLIPSNLQFECVELLAKYEIVLNLGRSHYFIPSLLPSDIQHFPLTRSNVSICIYDVDFGSAENLEYEDYDSCDDLDNNKYYHLSADSIDSNDVNVDDNKDYVNDDDNRVSINVDDKNFVNLMVGHTKLLANDEHCVVAKSASSSSSTSLNSNSSSSNAYTNHKLPVAPTNSHSQSTRSWDLDLPALDNFENGTDLFSPYKYKENSPSIMNNDVDITCYPALCRIWLSPFIPKSFWFRLVSRIVSATQIANVILKLLPTVNFNSIKDTQFSLWSLWQHSIAVVHKDITFLELKYKDDMKSDEEKNKRHKIVLSINVPEFLDYHQKSNIVQKSNIAQPDLSLSCEDVLGQATKLLVAIEQLILEICEWFPRTLTEDDLGGVLSYTPCYFCLQNEKSIKRLTSPTNKCTMISYDNHEVYCFSFSEMLASYAGDTAIVCPHHGKIPVQFCAPDMAFKDIQEVVCGPNIPLSIDYEKILGKGGSGVILRGEMIQSQKLVAIKVITETPFTTNVASYLNDYKTSITSYQMIRKEVSFLSSLHHENLTQLCGVFTNPYMLLIELAPLGSLRSIISEYQTADAALSSPVLCKSIKQIASALAFLHQRNVIYFDLKSDNVLVWKFPLPGATADHRVWLKLTDYGISRVSNAAFEIRTSSINGTPGYIAPEVLLGRSDSQADKIDVFSFGMTIYELLSLQKPFDNMYKINPSVDIDKYISKEKRPSLSAKGIWSPYLMQQVMNLCWEQEPMSRPQILQILKWCDLAEFQSLRAVSALDKGKFNAACQCTVNGGHTHTFFSNPLSNVKFTLQHCIKFDNLFTIPEIASPRPLSRTRSQSTDFNKSKRHTQVWTTQEVDENKTRLQIVTYRSTQVGYRKFTTLIQTKRVIAMVNVNNYMWIYTEEKNLFIYHTPTMENITCIQLTNDNSSLIEMVHVPKWNVVLASWTGSQLWCIHDQVTEDGLHVVDTIELSSKSPIMHLCTVELPQRTEVWITQGRKKVAIINHSPTGFSCKRTLTCNANKNLLFCNYITCLSFNSFKTGDSMFHVWVSFLGQPHVVCWDAEIKTEINSIIKNGSTDSVTSLLGYENQLYVGTQYGNVEVYDSESSIFLQQFSLHNGEVCRMFKLPPEVHQCVCPELLSNTDDKCVNRKSRFGLSDEDLTSQEKVLQKHALQQDSSLLPIVDGKLHPFASEFQPYTSFTDPNCIKAPLIISLGTGKADWLNVDSTEDFQPHILTWSGCSSINLYS